MYIAWMRDALGESNLPGSGRASRMLRSTLTISPRAGGVVDECSLVLACDLATLIFFRFSAAPEVEVHRKEANALRDFCVFLESSDHASRRHARSRAHVIWGKRARETQGPTLTRAKAQIESQSAKNGQ